MNGYADNQLNIVKQFQAERRAEAAAHRLATGAGPRGAPELADALGVKGTRLVVTAVLVVVGIGGLIRTLNLLAGQVHVKGPTLGVAGWLPWRCEICPEDRSLGRRGPASGRDGINIAGTSDMALRRMKPGFRRN